MDIVSGSFSISVGALYVRKYFNEDAKKNAVEMVSNIRSEFKKILDQVSRSLATIRPILNRHYTNNI